MQINIVSHEKNRLTSPAIACRASGENGATMIAAGIASRAHTSSTRHHAIKGASEVKRK